MRYAVATGLAAFSLGAGFACSNDDAPTSAPSRTTGGADGGGSSGRPGGGTTSSDGGTLPDGAPIGSQTGTDAISAVDFLASISVCTHVGQGIDDPTKSADAMTFAGIKNLRDDGNAGHGDDWIAMHARAGVLVDILANQNLQGSITLAKKLAGAGALLAVEGPNEPNNFAVTYGGVTSSFDTTFTPVANLQKDLYAAVKGDPVLAKIPVFHSSESGGSEPDNVGLQFLTIPSGATTTMPAGTKYADFANTHNYVCGHKKQLVDNVSWNASDPTLDGDWDGMHVEYGKTWHKSFAGYADADLVALPRVTTETGWETATADGAITQEQQAKVFLNLYLSAFKRGWSYTFVYMLRDDPVQGSWGFFDVDYTPKTSGTYLHNLTTILADTAKAPAGKLDYAIADEPATVHDLLLRKSSGKFEIVVWGERMTTGSDAITVTLKTPASISIYDPTKGTTPTSTLPSATTVPLTLTDHPLVLEL